MYETDKDTKREREIYSKGEREIHDGDRVCHRSALPLRCEHTRSKRVCEWENEIGRHRV